MCFPFLRSLRTCNSSLYLVFSFYKRTFLDIILLKATSNYLIYYFIGVLRVEEQTILLTSNVASCNSVPSGSELSSREQSRSFGVIIGGRVVEGVEVVIQRIKRIVTRLIRQIPDVRNDDLIFRDIKALAQAVIQALVYSIYSIQ